MTEPRFESNAVKDVYGIYTDLQNFRVFLLSSEPYNVFVLFAFLWIERRWPRSVDLPAGVWSVWGCPGVAVSCPVVTGEALRQGQRAFKPHTDHPGAATWPFLLWDWPVLGRKARIWNLRMACRGMGLGGFQIERGWQRVKINLQPKSKAALGRRSGLHR